MRQLWFEIRAVFVVIVILVSILVIIYCLQTKQYTQASVLLLYTIFITAGFVYMIKDRQKELFKSETPEEKG